MHFMHFGPFFYIWDSFDPKMQYTAPIFLITLSNHLLRKGDLFFREKGPQNKKGYPRGPRFSLGDPPDIPDFGIEPTLLGSKFLIPIFC